jgi:DNA-binding CsgD family transcriptional regulator
MGLVLAAADVARLTDATTVLLSSHDFHDLSSWAREAVRATGLFTGGSGTVLLFPTPAEALGCRPHRNGAHARAGAGRSACRTEERTFPGSVRHVGVCVPLRSGEARLYWSVPARARHADVEDPAMLRAALLLPAFCAGIRMALRAISGSDCAADNGLQPHGFNPMEPPVTPAEVPDGLLPRVQRLIRGYGLTRREAEVAILLSLGASDRLVAARLGISAHTARKHAEHIFSKLGIHTRKALALRLMSTAIPASLAGLLDS